MKHFKHLALFCLAVAAAGCDAVSTEPPDLQVMRETRPLAGTKEFNVDLKYDVGMLEVTRIADDNLFSLDLQYDRRRFDPKFRFYRSADIELSFQVKALGLRATVTRVPVIRHEHRMWTETPEDERARLSKRNFYRFLDRWRGRADLLVSRGGPGRPGAPGSGEGSSG